ncbi:nucleoside recognition domain-containing protein [Paenibacillus fonticola]|uniref:nucleoside recognition domain-containing protein n=1 Tax=Paenibacillus fonticola TaxID=379896 RepID=UPI001F0B67AD|nr:nucleoside recognition domain-containing protein [Paenibacillus fonticola]
MNYERPGTSGVFSTILMGTAAVLLVVCVIYAPSQAFEASSQGLALWWRIVFPSLLPFIVLSQILMATGFAHGLGTLIEPFTRRILGLPGSLGWILPLGMTAGFPAAAEAAATLYMQGRITAQEAEKMASFAHYCSPVLIVIVIGTAFMGQPEIGLLLLGVHWASGLSAALTMNWLSSARPSPARSGKRKLTAERSDMENGFRWRRAFRNMEEARREDGRSFGKLLGDSVNRGVQVLMSTGGYMLIFAVIIHTVSSLLTLIIPPAMSAAPIAALLEVHLGSHSLSKLNVAAPLPLALTGAALGWSGLCGYLQVRALLKPTGRSGAFFFVNRLVHGIYAYVFTLLLWNPLSASMLPANSAYRDTNDAAIWVAQGKLQLPQWEVFLNVVSWQLCILILLTTLTLFAALLWKRYMKYNSAL